MAICCSSPPKPTETTTTNCCCSTLPRPRRRPTPVSENPPPPLPPGRPVSVSLSLLRRFFLFSVGKTLAYPYLVWVYAWLRAQGGGAGAGGGVQDGRRVQAGARRGRRLPPLRRRGQERLRLVGASPLPFTDWSVKMIISLHFDIYFYAELIKHHRWLLMYSLTQLACYRFSSFYCLRLLHHTFYLEATAAGWDVVPQSLSDLPDNEPVHFQASHSTRNSTIPIS